MELTVLRSLLVAVILLDIAAIVVTVMLVLESRRDVRAVQQSMIGNGRRTVARTAWLSECLRVFSLVWILVWAVGSAIQTWDLPDRRLRPQLVLAFMAMGFAVLGILGQSAVVYRMRRRLFDQHRPKK